MLGSGPSVSLLAASLSVLLSASVSGQSPPPTEQVFGRYADRVVKIEVKETGSAAKASIGSGFFVSAAGHLMTNYHVISQVVQHPTRYRASYVDADGRDVALSVLNVDVANDLAVAVAERSTPAHFDLEPADAPQGLRLYSMGHAFDLGLKIVEGTYNGFLEHSLDRRIQFTGSLNPGMSGGPAITAEGRVVGINVASAGEQVSFLVPAERASTLVARTRADEFEPHRSLLALAREQIDEYQHNFVSTLLEDSPMLVELGPFTVPSEPAEFFNCWADADRTDANYETVTHQCSTVDYIYVSNELVSGRFWFRHRLIESDTLNPFQFDALYTRRFHRTTRGMGGAESEVTSFRCHSDTVSQRDTTFKTVFCLRGYRRLSELYDLVFTAAVVGKPRTGLVTSLYAAGVSFENAEALVRWYMGAIEWNGNQ